MMQNLLTEIAKQLNVEAVNYSVFLQLYDVPNAFDKDKHDLIRIALGANALLGGISEVNSNLLTAEINEALLYEGDDSAGPSRSVLECEKFLAVVQSFNAELVKLVDTSQATYRFWLKDGHPAYPVFWDFAFLFCRGNNATLLIGSSSD